MELPSREKESANEPYFEMKLKVAFFSWTVSYTWKSLLKVWIEMIRKSGQIIRAELYHITQVVLLRTSPSIKNCK